MEAGRERIDVGGGYRAYAHNLGYGVYSPYGWKIGDRKTLEGARRLAQRTVQKVLAQGRVSENPAVSVAPLRQIVAREEFDYEVAGQTFHAVLIRLECGHKEELGPCEWIPVRKRRRCVSCLHGMAN